MLSAPILAVLNPVAGRRRHDGFRAVIAQLREAGFEVDLRETRSRGDAEQLARGAASLGFKTILAGGGDGTINELVNGMIDVSLPLAIYPLGTANVLAREIGMPTDPTSFARLVRDSPPRPAWLGEISGRRFVLMASVGFDAHVVATLDENLKRRIGKGAYLAAAARHLLRHPSPGYRVTVDGRGYEAAAAVIAKGRYYAGGFVAAPLARITERRFHVCLLGGGRRKDMLRYAAALACGRLARLADVRIIDGHHVEITGVEGEPVQVDGEILARLPATARLACSPLSLVMSRSTCTDAISQDDTQWIGSPARASTAMGCFIPPVTV